MYCTQVMCTGVVHSVQVLQTRYQSSPFNHDRTSRDADSSRIDGVGQNDDLSLLTSVGEVVVPGAHVVVRARLSDGTYAEVEVCTSIIEFGHFTTKLY